MFSLYLQAVGLDKGDGRVHLLRPPGGHIDHLTAQLLQVGGLSGGLLAAAHYNHRPAPVEHAVAGGAVAHAPAQVLHLPGIFGLAHHPGGQDEGAALVDLAAHRQVEALPGHEGDHLAGDQAGSGLLRVAGEPLHQLRPGHGGQSQVVVHTLRPGQRAVLPAVAHHQDALVPAPGGHRGGQSRRAAAQDDNIVAHWFHLPPPPVRAGACSAF